MTIDNTPTPFARTADVAPMGMDAAVVTDAVVTVSSLILEKSGEEEILGDASIDFSGQCCL